MMNAPSEPLTWAAPLSGLVGVDEAWTAVELASPGAVGVETVVLIPAGTEGSALGVVIMVADSAGVATGDETS